MIYVSPINKSILYDNFIDNELYPFVYSSKIIILDNKSILKVLEEIDGFNGLLGDFLKVEVIEGYYKGRVGFLLEDSVRLSFKSKKSKVNVLFKEDTFLKDNNILIKRGLIYEIVESSLIEDNEVLTLKLDSAKSNDQNITVKYKNCLHLIINKYSEISYYLKREFNIIKVVDINTLMPIEGVEYKNIKSDIYGIIYDDFKENKYILKKNGYTDGIIEKNDNQKIFICFMEPIDYIDYYDDRGSIYAQDQYKFEVRSNNNSIAKKIGIKILSKNNYSIFEYPLLNVKNILIKGGFYLTDCPLNVELLCSIYMDEPVKLIHFDLNSMKWQDVQVLKNNIENCYNISNLNDGYYIIYTNTSNEYKKINLDIEFKNINRIFFRNQDSSIAGFSFNDMISISTGKYEFIYFNPENPFYLTQKQINIDDKINEVQLNIYKNKSGDIINNKSEDKENKYNSGLPSTYNGIWYREDIKKNNRFIRENENNIEYLGDFEIRNNNRIIISNLDYRIEGYIEVIDNKRLIIHATYVSGNLVNTNKNVNFIINPSLFNSQVSIPVLYSYYVGVLQLSFNGIFIERKNYYENPVKNNKTIKMDTISFITSEFPKSEKEAKYTIYFTQEKTVD